MCIPHKRVHKLEPAASHALIITGVQEHPWPALGASSFTRIYDGDIIVVDTDARWDWSAAVELCSRPWIPCALTIRGVQKCLDYARELDCRRVAGCAWSTDASTPDDSCQLANNGVCDEPLLCDLGTDSSDCRGNTGTCTGTPLSTSSGGGNRSAGNLYRNSSGVVACHAAHGCTGVTLSDVHVRCTPGTESPMKI